MDDVGTPGPPTGTGGPVVELHAERLTTATERVAVERVRFTKRIVRTTRTIEVPVRVEQLVIDHEPLDPADPVGTAASTGEDEFVIVLHEEVPEVSLRVVATERIVVGVRTVAEEETVSATLRSEVVDVVLDRD